LAAVFFVSIATAVALIVYIALNLPAARTEVQTAVPTLTVERLARATHAPTPTPGFGPISFSSGTNGERRQGAEALFPAGSTNVYASWSYENMQQGTPYRLAWYRNGVTWLNQPYVWDAQQHGAHGTAYHTPVDQSRAGGLPPGEYRLELFLGESQAQVGTFIMYDPDSDAQASGQAALASLVQVAVPYGGEWYLGGSGSIVNGELGLILTNWHVLVDENSGKLLNDGLAAILLLPEPGEPPLPDYWAEVLPEYSDPDLDLAILRIRTGTDGRQPVEVPLDLPAIPLGDSDSTDLGDHVLLLGYPDYAIAGPSWTEGIVATRNEEWILSDAQASHGHSGGMMLNEDGELTGVLTGYAETSVGGGFVRARPVNLAVPLIAAAEATE
jgi:hypothetical protein